MRRLIAVLLLVSFGSVGQAGQIGDDGMYKESWMRDTFKDLREDLAEANAEGKRLAVIFEQRGCIYCKKMHEEVFVQPRVSSILPLSSPPMILKFRHIDGKKHSNFLTIKILILVELVIDFETFIPIKNTFYN